MERAQSKNQLVTGTRVYQKDNLRPMRIRRDTKRHSTQGLWNQLISQNDQQDKFLVSFYFSTHSFRVWQSLQDSDPKKPPSQKINNNNRRRAVTFSGKKKNQI